jgi:hypothetical protein
MAIIKCGALVADIRGKVGTNVFSRNQGGAIVRDLGSWVQPDNEAQQACRDTIEALSKAWSSTLTESERQSWRSYAATNPRPNRWGTAGMTNGYCAFIRHNFQWGVPDPEPTFLKAPTSGPIHPPVITIGVQQAGAIILAGALNPDATGQYDPAGQYGDHPYWKLATGDWFMWHDTAFWRLTSQLGVVTASRWRCPFVDFPTGTWIPTAPATGNGSGTWSYERSLAKIVTPPPNYPDYGNWLYLFIYSGIPLKSGRSYFGGPYLKLITIAVPPLTEEEITWCCWTWPTRSVEPPWSWQPDGSGTARYYAIAQDLDTGSMSTRFVGTPTFGSLTPW